MVFNVSKQVSLLHTPAPRRASRPSATLAFLAGFVEIIVCIPPLAMILHATASGVRYTSSSSSAASLTLFAASPSLFLWPHPYSTYAARDDFLRDTCWWQMLVWQQNQCHAPNAFLLKTATSPVGFSLNVAATDTARLDCEACEGSTGLPTDGYESRGHEAAACSQRAAVVFPRKNSSGRSEQAGSLFSVAPEANALGRRRRFAGILSPPSKTVDHAVSCWKSRNFSAWLPTRHSLYMAEKHLNALTRVNEEAPAACCRLRATLAPAITERISRNEERSDMDDTATQACQTTVGSVSLQAALAKGRRPYRVIALFRSGLPLETVREDVATYVMQLRKWRSARLKAVYRGHRRLAYLIKGQETAHVVELTFDIYPSAVRFLRMKLHFDPAVLRFMILRNPPLPRSIIRRQHLIPTEEFDELLKYSGTQTT